MTTPLSLASLPHIFVFAHTVGDIGAMNRCVIFVGVLFAVGPGRVGFCSDLARPHTVECVLALVDIMAAANLERSTTFVQIGAHLAWANTNDPFRSMVTRSRMRSVLVEPQPHIYHQLVGLVGSHSEDEAKMIEVVNAAICPESRGGANVTFFSISPLVNPLTGALPTGRKQRHTGASFTSQLASMSREHILKHRRFIPNIEDHIVEIQVPCLSVAELLERQRVEPRDVLVLSIDAEGYDDVILDSVDFETTRPFLVVFEFQHLIHRQRREHAWDAVHTAERRLSKFGYRCWRAPPENFFCTSPKTSQQCAEWKPGDSLKNPFDHDPDHPPTFWNLPTTSS